MCGLTRARFVTRFTHKLLRHRASYIHHHVIVLFDSIVEQLNLLRGVGLPFEHYVFTRQALIDSTHGVPKHGKAFRQSVHLFVAEDEHFGSTAYPMDPKCHQS